MSAHLKWEENNIVLGQELENIWKNGEMIDVTLVCDDRKQISAHKVVLASYSTFFRDVINNNPHPKPLIYLKGIAYSDLLLILKFLYTGEARVSQSHLKEFLEVAEDLKIKGLIEEKKTKQKTVTYKEENSYMPQIDPSEEGYQHWVKSEIPDYENDDLDNPELYGDQPVPDIEMLPDGTRLLCCTICDSKLKNRKSYRGHMIGKHNYPKHKATEYKCEVCGAVYRHKRKFERCRHKALNSSNTSQDMSEEQEINEDGGNDTMPDDFPNIPE